MSYRYCRTRWIHICTFISIRTFFYLNILCSNFKVLSYKVLFWREMLKKCIMFSNSKIVLTSILTKIIVIMFFHNLAALALVTVVTGCCAG